MNAISSVRPAVARVTGVDFVSLTCAAEKIVRAGSAAYWLESYGGDGGAMGVQHNDISDGLSQIAAILGLRLVPVDA